jgi:hypothetical protein
MGVVLRLSCDAGWQMQMQRRATSAPFKLPFTFCPASNVAQLKAMLWKDPERPPYPPVCNCVTASQRCSWCTGALSPSADPEQKVAYSHCQESRPPRSPRTGHRARPAHWIRLPHLLPQEPCRPEPYLRGSKRPWRPNDTSITSLYYHLKLLLLFCQREVWVIVMRTLAIVLPSVPQVRPSISTGLHHPSYRLHFACNHNLVRSCGLFAQRHRPAFV